MKYNKSEIMRKAHELYRAGGLTASQAVTKAWCLTKIATLKDELFILQMKDRMNSSSWSCYHELANRVEVLKRLMSSAGELTADQISDMMDAALANGDHGRYIALGKQYDEAIRREAA